MVSLMFNKSLIVVPFQFLLKTVDNNGVGKLNLFLLVLAMLLALEMSGVSRIYATKVVEVGFVNYNTQ